jgi:choline dehydrogenase-like flavoprotein
MIPDIELMPTAINTIDDTDEHWRLYSKLGLCSILATAVQPKSRGTVRLASSDPHDRPKVDFGFLSNPADYTVLRKAIKLSLTMIEAMRATGFPMIRGVTFPEEKYQKDVENGNTEEMDKFIRHRARPTFHFSCTCRMASEDDPQAPGVVDDKLRVYGVSNLRVCDTSVFPQIISSHLQAPAVMIAERCADFIQHPI